jgi:glycosyltransferase involved in cell wall biosynthesis
MKVAIIGTRGIPANYGGFETLAEYLTQHTPEDLDYTVYCSAKAYKTKLPSHNKAHLHYINLDANGIQSIPYDLWSILKAVKEHDVLLILGVASGLFLPLLKWMAPSKRIILNVDGLEWQRAKWNGFAKWFLRLSEKVGSAHADEVVADNSVIQQHLAQSYGVEAHLIAYGGDHVKKQTLTTATLDTYPFLKLPYCFKVCRIEPENNISMILEAFTDIPEQQLVLVGNWKRSAYGRDLFKTFSNYDHIHLLDPIYNQIQLDQLRSNARIYIHGHSAGGTNPSLVEAMHLALPVLAFNVNYNVETTQGKAQYFGSAKELRALVRSLTDHDLQGTKKALKGIAERDYTWSRIAEAYQMLMK